MKYAPASTRECLAKTNKRVPPARGDTGQMFLRFVGWDGFVTSHDVVACLRDVDIGEEVKSKGDLAKVQVLGGRNRPAQCPFVAARCRSARTISRVRI